ncbi:MAG: FG-GAP-like repeat-containing protein [Acidobacteriota bacterium]
MNLIPTLLVALLPLSLCSAQVLELPQDGVEKARPATQSRKQAVERHFESISPQPRPQFGGAVPGSALLARHRSGGAQLQARVRAALMARPQAQSGSAASPGILFRPAIPAGALPTSVVTGDFNGDGKMDFIVANGITNDLWLYLGNGDGTFQLPRIIPLSKGLSPVGLATASLRNNGILDLVVAETDSSTVGVLFGNGDGTFGYETEYELPEPPESIVIDDFNHDGKLDIAAVMDTVITPASNQIPYIALLNGDGTGSFGSPVITYKDSYYITAWNIASGDVNGDGLPDLLITGPGWENSQIYLNSGGGTFKAGQTLIANDSFRSLLDGRLADVNGDGCLDGVVADAWTFVWIFPGDCSGNFGTPTQIQMGDSNAAVRVADVNGDGKPDIVTSGLPALNPELGFLAGNTLNIALGDGKGNFTVGRNYVGTGQSYSIGVADFNGDGYPDFVTAENDSDTVTVYHNDGAGGFGFPQGLFAGIPGQYSVNQPFSALSFADLNGDGKTDVSLLSEGYKGELYATSFLNDGTGKFASPINSDTGVSVTSNQIGDYRLGDFRNSGKLDLLAIGLDQELTNSTQFVLFLTGNGDGTFTKGTPVTTTGADGILTTGDFNKDGKLDFVAVNGANTHTLTTFVGNGDGTFRGLAPVTFSDTGNGVGGTLANRIYTGDFNRDGKLDVLVFTTGNGYWTTESTIWEFDGNGDGTFQAPRQLFTDFQPFALADVNGDGHPDIARYDFMWPDGTTQTTGPSKFTTYVGQADGSFAKSSYYTPYAGIPESVQPYSQNGDPLATSLVGAFGGNGMPDEVAFQIPPSGLGDVNYAQMLAGNGDGTFTPTYDMFPFYLYGRPLYAHDLDGDGFADMVEVDSGNSQLHVIKGGSAPAIQMGLEESIVKGNQGCGWVFPNLASSSSQTVALSSSVSGVTLPSSVTIPAGALSAKFCYTLANNFNWRQVFDISATLNGSTATAYASDSYALGFSATVSSVTPAAVYQGQSSAPLTLTLTPSPGYSSTPKLYCTGLNPGDSCEFASSTLNISTAGPASTTVTLATAANAAAYGNTHTFTIVADDGNVIQRQTVALGVATLTMTAQSPLNIPATAPGVGTEAFSVNGIPPYQFNCSGLPAGASCSFSGTQQSFPSPSVINVAVNVPAGLANGNYPFTVTAASQTYSASAQETLQVVSYTVQGPPSGSDWAIAGTTQNIPINVQGSSNWWGGTVSFSCTLDVASTCTGGSAVPGMPMNLSLNVPAGTPLGQHQMTVIGTYAGSTQKYTFPIYVVSFSGSLSGSTLTVARGGSGTMTATLTASTGFSNSVSLACSGSTQLTCSFNPSSPQLTGGTPLTVTINVNASATASLESKPAHSPLRSMTVLAGMLPLAFFCGILRSRRRNVLLLFLLGLVTLGFMGACGGAGGSAAGGGGGTSGGGGGGSNTYTLTVTASPNNTTSLVSTLGTVSVTVTH